MWRPKVGAQAARIQLPLLSLLASFREARGVGGLQHDARDPAAGGFLALEGPKT